MSLTKPSECTLITTTADWGWHCAIDYPRVKVYTVTQRPPKPTSGSVPIESAPTATSPHLRGPRNHRHVSVERLYRLPFPDNHFDVVSARTLFLILRSSAKNPRNPHAPGIDEYDRVLDECMRVLKPGGYLEYMLFDSAVVNAGPLAEELYPRFARGLQESGRDPEPTARWITRLYASGFTDVKRAWSFLPLAPPAEKPRVPEKDHVDQGEDPAEQVRARMQTWGGDEAGAAETGTSKDVAAVTGLLSGWVWEKWLRTAGIFEVETVGNVIEEAKDRGSGLRNLVGYAMKPLE